MCDCVCGIVCGVLRLFYGMGERLSREVWPNQWDV